MRSLYKIVHTSCHTGWGGLERRILNEARWMKDQGHQVVIVAPKESPLLNKARNYGLRVYAVYFRPLSTLQDYVQLKHIFQNERPHILNSHGTTDARLALRAALKTGVPCRILSRHTSSHVKNTWSNRQIYKKLNHFIFTTANHTTQHIQNLFKLKGQKIFSIPNGIVEPDSLMPKDEARKALAAELFLDPGTRFIGFVGRVYPEKGIDTILQAFKLIRSDIPHHIAVVGAGTSSFLSELKTLAQSLNIEDRVHFTGLKENTWPYYRAFDCKVLASKNINGSPFEGVPPALLKAMYSSCPVIGSDTGGIPDIIDHEMTGFLFDPQNPGELAEMILKTLTQEALTLERVHGAREMVKKYHTMDAMGRDIIRIYRLHQVKLEQPQSINL